MSAAAAESDLARLLRRWRPLRRDRNRPSVYHPLVCRELPRDQTHPHHPARGIYRHRNARDLVVIQGRGDAPYGYVDRCGGWWDVPVEWYAMRTMGRRVKCGSAREAWRLAHRWARGGE